VTALLALLLGYLLGALPSAALAARLKGKRIFEVGSSNMGAMNTARNLGWGLGALVLLLDLGKGALATALGLQLGGGDLLPALAGGLGAVLGHLWSVYVGFRGGKGLATTLGVALPLYPLGGLYALLLLLALTALLRDVTRGVLLTALLYPGAVYLSLLQHAPTERTLITLGAAAVALPVALKHATFRPPAPSPQDARPGPSATPPPARPASPRARRRKG